MSDGGHLALYDNHDALRREIARHSKRDAEAYDRYSRDVIRQCKFIKPLLLLEPPKISPGPRVAQTTNGWIPFCVGCCCYCHSFHLLTTIRDYDGAQAASCKLRKSRF